MQALVGGAGELAVEAREVVGVEQVQLLQG
jgi:hypothetical protein